MISHTILACFIVHCRATNQYLKDAGCHQVDKVQEGTGDNHAISALKFKIIKEFLVLGCSVLLSDVDIVVLQVCHWRYSIDHTFDAFCGLRSQSVLHQAMSGAYCTVARSIMLCDAGLMASSVAAHIVTYCQGIRQMPQ